MNKIIFFASVVGILAATPAFAQDDNISVINQVGSSTNASAIVDQEGVDGNVNDSNIRQDGVNEAKAKVTQIQFDSQNAKKNESDIQQSGAWIESKVTQQGRRNNSKSKIIQDGTGNNSVQKSKVTVLQEGRRNTNDSEIRQNGKDSTVNVKQYGRDNTNDSFARQEGDSSTIKVEQGGNDNTNISEIRQFADDSSVDVSQGLGTVGMDHRSTVYQDGSFNTVKVTQK